MILGREPIGQVIKQWRVNLGMSQAELCRRSNVNPDALSRLEAGKMINPPWEMIYKIFTGMNASIEIKIDLAPTMTQLPLGHNTASGLLRGDG